MKLTAIIYRDSDTHLLVAECPEIGTASQGHTEDDAMENLREATKLYLESFPFTAKRQSTEPDESVEDYRSPRVRAFNL